MAAAVPPTDPASQPAQPGPADQIIQQLQAQMAEMLDGIGEKKAEVAPPPAAPETPAPDPAVAEAAAIGAEDPIKGEMIAAFVILRDGVEQSDELRADLAVHVATDIGKFAKPSLLLFAPDLPKTRSGKIMRGLLKNIAEGKELGDATTLLDPAIVQTIKADADRQMGRE